jgi:hypothetical protein
MTRSMYRLTEVNVRPLTDSPEHSPRRQRDAWAGPTWRRRGRTAAKPSHSPEARPRGRRWRGGRTSRAGSWEQRTGKGQGSCAATRARRQSMAGSGWARGFAWCRTCRLGEEDGLGSVIHGPEAHVAGEEKKVLSLSLSRLSRGDPAVARRTLGAMGNASGRMDEGFPRGSPPGSPPPMFVPQVRDSLFHILYINCNAHSSSNCL